MKQNWTMSSLAFGVLSTALATGQNYAYGNIGNDFDGADVVIGNVAGTSRPDMILVAMEDATNVARYIFLRDLADDGRPAARLPSQWHTIATPLGGEQDGLGAALTELNGNSRPDLVVAVLDVGNPANAFRWIVAFDLGPDGSYTSLSPIHSFSGLGDTADGVGVAIGNLDNDPRPDMILMGLDVGGPYEEFRYRVGLNLNAAGQPSNWTDIQFIATGLTEADGAGCALANLDSDPRPDLVLTCYDDPSGPNRFVSYVGYNLDARGRSIQWETLSSHFVGLHGSENGDGQPEGAGIAVTNLDSDPRLDLAFVANDPGNPANFFSVDFRRNFIGSSSPFGSGCRSPGTGAPGIRVAPATRPREGDALTIQVTDATAYQAGALLFGIGAAPAPFDLSVFGLVGCTHYVPGAQVPLFGLPIAASTSFYIPGGNDGLRLHFQGLAFGAGGIALTGRLDVIIGNG